MNKFVSKSFCFGLFFIFLVVANLGNTAVQYGIALNGGTSDHGLYLAQLISRSPILGDLYFAFSNRKKTWGS